METAVKTGVGSYAVQIGELKVGAIVVLNALGDIYDWKTGRQIAGLLSGDKSELRSTMELMCRSIKIIDNKFTGNTTIAVIITNAHFEKAQLFCRRRQHLRRICGRSGSGSGSGGSARR